jgi:microcystin-dependent protein
VGSVLLFDSTRMKQIEDTTVVSGLVNASGDLILRARDNTEMNAGHVVGPKGDPGAPGISSSFPSGLVNQFAGTTAPSGWLFCLGQSLSRADYPSLFAAISTLYGSIDSFSFNLPNLKGRAPVGIDTSQVEFNALGKTGGAKTHILATAEMPSHAHTQSAHSHYIDGPQGGQLSASNGGWTSGNGPGYAPWFGGGYNAVPANVSSQAPAIQATGGDGAHNNLQPYITLNYIIKI